MNATSLPTSLYCMHALTSSKLSLGKLRTLIYQNTHEGDARAGLIEMGKCWELGQVDMSEMNILLPKHLSVGCHTPTL